MTTSSATASSAMPPGTRLGEFELTGVIGEGGFGIVYSARDSSLDRIVAIKEYLPSAFASRTAAGTVQVRSEEHSKTFNAGLSSFINEARLLAKFSHPGLVEVFRFWEANGTAYMAMRYYRGVTLRDVLRTNPQMVTEQWLCETLDPILLALQELHSEKCYHRDIAPDNILVLPNGRSILMDFGAARRIIGGMTRALTTVLKPGYAPIEQYSDDGSIKQGAWTDIYAIGGVLYHAMTGKVPVQAISRMMNDPLKPVATVAKGSYSENLCAVVMRCLSVMPENRYQSIDELRTALGWITTPVSSTVVLPRPTRSGDASAAAVVVPSPAVSPAPSMLPTMIAQPKSADANQDPLAALTASSTAPTRSPGAMVETGSTAPDWAGMRPAATPTKKADSGASTSQRSSFITIAVVALVAIALLGSALYMFLARDEPSGAVQVAPTSPSAAKSKADGAVPPPVETIQKAPADPASTKSIEPQPSPAPTIAAQSNEAATKPAPTSVAPAKVAEKPQASELGRVDLRIRPWGNVTVGGVERGASPPMMQISLPAGTHTIVIQNPSGPSVTKTVEVIAGKTVTVRHNF